MDISILTLAEQGDYQAIKDRQWTRQQLDEYGSDGRTALMRAAIRGDYRVIEVLKDLGADIDLTDNDGRKAVHLAALHGQSTAMVYLIEGGCGG